MRPTDEVFPGGDPSRPWRAPPNAAPLNFEYEGAGAAVTVDGHGHLRIAVDGGAEQTIEVTAPGLYELSEHERHGKHHLTLHPASGLELYALTFAPGVP
jgi:hypothetical protein